ncbi:IS607 family transposase [Mycobacterium sp. SM1]|uniref:IS607 family transposase n=1 Tax=Mycobacterium sp. SM1 TaxID=2816243 RepID=UPI001BCEC40E|nr:IS607 family transposase [Mycobacterium sp. SM1]MBS4727344.1 IS607 family transposase [Mycobacterium sp. SM1]
MNLTEWARAKGIHPQTAYRWFREGMLPVPAVRVNERTVLVCPDAPAGSAPQAAFGLYARVSSGDQKSDLDRQVARLTGWAAEAGGTVVRVEAEVGSGMSGSRAKIRRLLADPKVTAVVVEHRDRLGRVNTELVEAALAAHGRRLVVLDDGEVTDDLLRDMVEVLTRFCARLYGRRGARNRALKAVGCARRNIGPAAVVGGRVDDAVHG